MSKLYKECCKPLPSMDMIRRQVTANPDAVKFRNRFGVTPLHAACGGGSQLEVIQYLVEQWPESVKAVDNFGGSLPLHWACNHKKAPVDVIQYLVEQWPESVNVVVDKHGWLPLHLACSANSEDPAVLEVIQYLVEQRPELVKTADNNGCLALHYACTSCKTAPLLPLAVVQYLVKQWPESVQHRNSRGKTPLGHAQLTNDTDDIAVIINWLQLPWRDRFN
jgi:ankyrin repeat protein